MQRFLHEQILDEIGILLDWNPPSLSPVTSACPKVAPPSCFYYKHLDERLSLKSIIPMPSLVPDLSATVDRVLEDIKEREIVLPPLLIGDPFPTSEYCRTNPYREPITDAYSVAKAYQSTTADHCRLIASMLFLSPKSPTWEPFLVWTQNEESTRDNPGLDENFVLHMNDHVGTDGVPDEVWSSVEEGSLMALRRIVHNSPVLALWEIFAITPDNEFLLKTIGKPIHTFHPENATNIKDVPPGTSLSYRPDATTVSWGAPISSLVGKAALSLGLDTLNPEGSKHPSRRSSRTQKSRATRNAVGGSGAEAIKKKVPHEENFHTILLPDRPSQTETNQELLSKSILKHAWLRAVHNDSSFVIFHCGNFERIAFRHRGSQALYISDLIDIPRCKDPGYGKLHIGLYMSIMHDALDRTRQQSEQDHVTKSTKRRRGEDAPRPNPKRPRTRALAAKLLADEIEYEKSCDYLTNDATRCDLLLLKMCYGVYNSHSPSLFLRSGRSQGESTSYEPHQYLSITLTSEIASGAIGIAHGATLQFVSESGKVHNMSVVVKLAMKPHQQKKLQYEYSVYERLALSRVQGIPRVFGLFKDRDSDLSILVMTHNGECLSTLQSENSDIVVKEPQRSAFIRIMKDIHHSGVRHRDIRPENLTIDEEGKVFIIDFDRAELDPTEATKARELLHITALLDGYYTPPSGVPSERTTSFGDDSDAADSRASSYSGSRSSAVA